MLHFVSKHLIPFFILRISNLGRVPELLINSEKRVLPVHLRETQRDSCAAVFSNSGTLPNMVLQKIVQILYFCTHIGNDSKLPTRNSEEPYQSSNCAQPKTNYKVIEKKHYKK